MQFRFNISPEQQLTPIQLARTGKFYRSDVGKFMISRRWLMQMRANTIERGVKIPIKYTHDGNVYAAGWVDPMTLSVRPWGSGGYGLFGKCEFTDDARSAIKRKEMQYISPEIEWNSRRAEESSNGPAGEIVGPLLVGAALVLDPFFNMDPVRVFSSVRKYAQGVVNMDMISPKKVDELAAMLTANGVGEDSAGGLAAKIILSLLQGMYSEEGMEESMEESAEEVPLEAAASEEEMTEEEKKKKEEEGMDAGMGKVAKAFGLKAGASADSIAMAASQLKGMLGKVQTRLAALESKENERVAASNEELFARFEREGRFRMHSSTEDPKGSKAARKIFEKGVDVFSAVFENVQPLTNQAAPSGKAETAVRMDGKVTPSQVHEFASKNNVSYSTALQTLLKSAITK